MNFIAATVELRSISPDPINAYGLEYRSADAVSIVMLVVAERSSFEPSVTTEAVPSLTRSSTGSQAPVH